MVTQMRTREEFMASIFTTDSAFEARTVACLDKLRETLGQCTCCSHYERNLLRSKGLTRHLQGHRNLLESGRLTRHMQRPREPVMEQETYRVLVKIWEPVGKQRRTSG